MEDTIYRQEALEGLYDVFFDDELSAAYPKEADKVLDVIRKLPSAQPERPEQPESAKEYCAECNHIEMCRWYPYEGCEFRSLPSAQPERKKGRWIKLDMHAHLADHKCTACGQECYVPTCMGEPMYAYCPNCGADMRGEQDEHND